MVEGIITFLDSVNWTAAAFHILAAVIIISAVLVVFSKNIVHSVLWLAVCFISLAGVFITLNAEFIALVQVMIYAGAVCIMLVFGIMLIRRGHMGETNLFNSQFIASGVVALLITVLSALLSYRTRLSGKLAPVPDNAVENIATLLLSKYVIPFEVAALLLLVALIGAIFLAREVKADARSDS